jgi:hypothetical protein
MAILAMVFLSIATLAIFYYEIHTDLPQMLYIFGIYILLIISAKIFSSKLPKSISERQSTDQI